MPTEEDREKRREYQSRPDVRARRNAQKREYRMRMTDEDRAKEAERIRLFRANNPRQANLGGRKRKRLKVPIHERLNRNSSAMPSGCVVWTASIDRYGYGQINVNGTTRQAHRVAYEATNGPIPEGLVIDHLCRTRSCINPDHMEPVTNAENIRRGDSGKRKPQSKKSPRLKAPPK